MDAQLAWRKKCADWERRLEGLAVAVLTALGERDASVLDTERRAGVALRTMTIDDCLSVRERSSGAPGASQCGMWPGCAAWWASLRSAYTVNAPE